MKPAVIVSPMVLVRAISGVRVAPGVVRPHRAVAAGVRADVDRERDADLLGEVQRQVRVVDAELLDRIEEARRVGRARAGDDGRRRHRLVAVDEVELQPRRGHDAGVLEAAQVLGHQRRRVQHQVALPGRAGSGVCASRRGQAAGSSRGNRARTPSTSPGLMPNGSAGVALRTCGSPGAMPRRGSPSSTACALPCATIASAGAASRARMIRVCIVEGFRFRR